MWGHYHHVTRVVIAVMRSSCTVPAAMSMLYSKLHRPRVPAGAVCAAAVAQGGVVCKCSTFIDSLHFMISESPRGLVRYIRQRRASALYSHVSTRVSIGNSHSAGISSNSAGGGGGIRISVKFYGSLFFFSHGCFLSNSNQDLLVLI